MSGHVVALLHAPKTGGTARHQAVRDVPHLVLERGHDLRAGQCVGTPRIAVVREPVDRFLSAWAAHDISPPLLDDLLAQPGLLFQHLGLRPQVHWYDRPDIEHLIAFDHWPIDFRRVMAYYNIPIRDITVVNPARRPKLVLTPAQAARIQSIYDEDHELWLEASA